MGLLDPATSDGRVIFFLPWENATIAGTTDSPTNVTHHPGPMEEDIQFILREVENYLSPEVHGRLIRVFLCVTDSTHFLYCINMITFDSFNLLLFILLF